MYVKILPPPGMWPLMFGLTLCPPLLLHAPVEWNGPMGASLDRFLATNSGFGQISGHDFLGSKLGLEFWHGAENSGHRPARQAMELVMTVSGPVREL